MEVTDALSSGRRIGAALHALAALQGPRDLRMLRLESARRGHGYRPLPGWARIEAGDRYAEPTGDVEGGSEAGDQVEWLHDGTRQRLAPRRGPRERRRARRPLSDPDHPRRGRPHPAVQRILP